MIDTSSFETNVFIDQRNDETGKVQHVTFKNKANNVVFVYKYRTRKTKKSNEVEHHE